MSASFILLLLEITAFLGRASTRRMHAGFFSPGDDRHTYMPVCHTLRVRTHIDTRGEIEFWGHQRFLYYACCCFIDTRMLHDAICIIYFLLRHGREVSAFTPCRRRAAAVAVASLKCRRRFAIGCRRIASARYALPPKCQFSSRASLCVHVTAHEFCRITASSRPESLQYPLYHGLARFSDKNAVSTPHTRKRTCRSIRHIYEMLAFHKKHVAHMVNSVKWRK